MYNDYTETVSEEEEEDAIRSKIYEVKLMNKDKQGARTKNDLMKNQMQERN